MDAVYDRAALVAIAPERRQDYASHLAAVTGQAPQLLITFNYDQSTMQGPPFSVPAGMVRALYGDGFVIDLLERRTAGGLLGQRLKAQEEIWLLTPPH